MQEARRVCVRGLIYKNGKIFGQKLKTTSDYWCTPGGGIDPLESLQNALTREIIEETGVKPVIGRLVLVQQFATKGNTTHGENEQLEFFFLIENAEDYESINLEETSHGLAEIAEFGFIDPVKNNMLPKILQTREVIDAIENNKPVIFFSQLD